ncbi:MAG: hypothetical protein AAF570_08520 [Bacteroidota bacterium]
MKKLTILICLFAFGLGFHHKVSAQCHMEFDDLRPIIDRYNPFFTDHSWEDDSKTETARLDQMRLLVIRQKSCMRHHVLFSMHIDAATIEDTDRFWISEMLVMLKRVYFNDPVYIEYKKKFEKEYIRQFLAAGLNKTFTFPVDDRSFICRVDRGDWGAKVKIESVKFVLKENVKQPGIAREKDDGWFKGRR